MARVALERPSGAVALLHSGGNRVESSGGLVAQVDRPHGAAQHPVNNTMWSLTTTVMPNITCWRSLCHSLPCLDNNLTCKEST